MPNLGVLFIVNVDISLVNLLLLRQFLKGDSQVLVSLVLLGVPLIKALSRLGYEALSRAGDIELLLIGIDISLEKLELLPILIKAR